jgi:signal transduction histidine kinase
MIVDLLLFIDFGLLGLVFFFYIRRMLRERSRLQGATTQSLELQQKVYQIQILREIGARIGYSLDTGKIAEIITSSIGSLLEYDTVAFILFDNLDEVTFKVHVHQSVNHNFLEEVRAHMIQSINSICGSELDFNKSDQRITGTILDDSLKVRAESFVNIPVIVSNRLLGLINVASSKKGLYDQSQAGILYSITNEAGTAVSQLQTVLDSEQGKLRGVIYSMTDGVLMVDVHNQLLVSNPAVKEFLQLPEDHELSMFDVIDALAGKVDLRTKIEEAISKDAAIKVPELYLKDRALELTITPAKDPTGETMGVSVILHDVTSEKSLEKLRQEFTAMMVHELRAPLTAVRWSSESLLKGVNSDDHNHAEEAQKIKNGVITIENAATNMLDLVNDLLDVAKIEAGKFDLNLQEYDLVEIVKQQINTFQAEAEVKHLRLNLTAMDKCVLKCDKVRISQVMDNLISNAIKYTDSGEIDINVSCDSPATQAVVSIKDSGVGVSREDLNQLFSKFKQLTSTDRSRQGTGLGLVVSKGIVEAHGGKIWAESAGENMGSTFYFSLPLKHT